VTLILCARALVAALVVGVVAIVFGLTGCEVCPPPGTEPAPVSFETWAHDSAAAVVSVLHHRDPCAAADLPELPTPPVSPASTSDPVYPCAWTEDRCALCILACAPSTAACGPPATAAVYQAALACAEGRCADECSPP